jgi:hypothetical protein
VYTKPIANSILNREKLKSFPLQLGIKKDVHSPHSYSIKYCNPKAIRQEKEIKNFQRGRKEVKLSKLSQILEFRQMTQNQNHRHNTGKFRNKQQPLE